MAWTATAPIEAPYDSGSKGNGVQRYAVVGATTGVGAVTVKAAVEDKQIYFKGQISASAACKIDFKSAAGGTVVQSIFFLAAGTMLVKCAATLAGELLEIASDTDVTVRGVIFTLPVASGQVVPPEWKLGS